MGDKTSVRTNSKPRRKSGKTYKIAGGTPETADEKTEIEKLKKFIKYLYVHKTEFLFRQSESLLKTMSGSGPTPTHLVGNYICKVVSYDFTDNEIKYQIQFVGYIEYDNIEKLKKYGGCFIVKDKQNNPCNIGYRGHSKKSGFDNIIDFINNLVAKDVPSQKYKNTYEIIQKINGEKQLQLKKPESSEILYIDELYDIKHNGVLLYCNIHNTLLNQIKYNYIYRGLAISSTNESGQLIPATNTEDTLYKRFEQHVNSITLDDNEKKDRIEFTFSGTKKEFDIEVKENSDTFKIFRYKINVYEKPEETEKRSLSPTKILNPKFEICESNTKTNEKKKKLYILKTKNEINNDNIIRNMNLKDEYKSDRNDLIQDIKDITGDYFDTTWPNKNKFMFISHNIQFREAENGLAYIFQYYKNNFFNNKILGRQNDENQSLQSVDKQEEENNKLHHMMKQNLIFVFQEAGWKSLDETIYGEGDFMYVNCAVGNGELFLYKNMIYGSNSFRTGTYTDKNLIYKHKHIETDKDNNIKLNLFNDGDKEKIKLKFIHCNKIYHELKNKKSIGGNSAYKRGRSSIDNPSLSPTSKRKKYLGYYEQISADVIQFLDKVERKLLEIDRSNEFKKLQIWKANVQMNTIMNMFEKYENSEDVQQIFNQLIFDVVYFRPQFAFKKFNIENNSFEGLIMVHDISRFFSKGLINNNIQNGGVILNKTVVDKALKVREQEHSYLYSISCDERMNFKKEKQNGTLKNNDNKTKQLCLLFHKSFFNPLINTDKTHVLLLGLNVEGPTKNHVALVLASNDFSDVIINVHLESAGQGVSDNSHERALTELDLLLKYIVGRKPHPFFENNKESIERIRIFGDFNLSSTIIAKLLANFKKGQKYKDYKLELLLDNIKTHENQTTTKTAKTPKTTNTMSGCIDNVIYITKQSAFNIQNVIIGDRKRKNNNNISKDEEKTLSDHSPLLIIEDNSPYNNTNAPMDIDIDDDNYINSFKQSLDWHY